MKTSLIITDVTRMNEGRVCIAGYDQNGNCIRPVLPPPGILETMLYDAQDHPVIFPFADVEFDLLQPVPEPPHVEDYRYDPHSVRFLRRVGDDERRNVLQSTLFATLDDLFGVAVQSGPGYYIPKGQGCRSLGTIRPKVVSRVAYQVSEDGKPTYRLGFFDDAGVERTLTVTDLTWRYYLEYGRRKGFSPRRISSDLTRALQHLEVYLRIGLARGWEKYPDRCYVQITGIYTFPDTILKGRTFADFAEGPGAGMPF